MRSTALLFALFASACAPSSTSESKENLEGRAEHVSDCCKLEGGEIGTEAALVRLGTKYVLVGTWIPKTGSPGEYAGFSIDLAGGSSVEYVVKAGGETYRTSATTWMHPNGPDGDSATPGISNVDFCEECDNPDGCDHGDGDPQPDPDPDPDPGCDNPDGCPTDDGSGPIL